MVIYFDIMLDGWYWAFHISIGLFEFRISRTLSGKTHFSWRLIKHWSKICQHLQNYHHGMYAAHLNKWMLYLITELTNEWINQLINTACNCIIIMMKLRGYLYEMYNAYSTHNNSIHLTVKILHNIAQEEDVQENAFL